LLRRPIIICDTVTKIKRQQLQVLDQVFGQRTICGGVKVFCFSAQLPKKKTHRTPFLALQIPARIPAPL
jgi:hypothetical protein